MQLHLDEFNYFYLTYTALFCLAIIPLVRGRINTCDKYWKLMLLTYILGFFIYIFTENQYAAVNINALRLLDVLAAIQTAIFSYLYFISVLKPAKLTPKFIMRNIAPYIVFLVSIVVMESFFDKEINMSVMKDYFSHLHNPMNVLILAIFTYLFFFVAYILFDILSTYRGYSKRIAAGRKGNSVGLLVMILLFSVLTILNLFHMANIEYTLLKMMYVVVAPVFMAYAIFNGCKQEVLQEIAVRPNNNTKLPTGNAMLKTKLLKYFDEQKPYLNKDLTLNDLALELNTNRSYLSRGLHRDFNSSFYAFVNSYRLEYACGLMKQNGNLTIESYAEMAGFKSRSVFFKEFKKHMGHTPYAYISISSSNQSDVCAQAELGCDAGFPDLTRKKLRFSNLLPLVKEITIYRSRNQRLN